MVILLFWILLVGVHASNVVYYTTIQRYSFRPNQYAKEHRINEKEVPSIQCTGDCFLMNRIQSIECFADYSNTYLPWTCYVEPESIMIKKPYNLNFQENVIGSRYVYSDSGVLEVSGFKYQEEENENGFKFIVGLLVGTLGTLFLVCLSSPSQNKQKQKPNKEEKKKEKENKEENKKQGLFNNQEEEKPNKGPETQSMETNTTIIVQRDPCADLCCDACCRGCGDACCKAGCDGCCKGGGGGGIRFR